MAGPGRPPIHDERGSGRTPDAYATLGVRADADHQEILAAYRALARAHHPDIAGEAATARMSRINAAFELLRDETRRDAYDRELDALDVAAGRPPTRLATRRARAQAARLEAERRRRMEADRNRPPTPFRPQTDQGPGGSPRNGSNAGAAGTTTGWSPERDGTGGAGPAPGRPSGSVLRFGRHLGWSIGEIARVDPGYLEWLEQRREGLPYLDEIDDTLVRVGFRAVPRRPRPPSSTSKRRRGR